MRNRVSELPATQSALDVSGRHELLWERELAYEVRALKVVTRCMQGRILCGDKSGRVSCFDFDNNNKKGWESRERAGGPIYDLTLLHPLSNGVDLLDPACHRCLIVAGAGNGDLVFLDYLSGQAVEVDCGGGPSHRYRFESSVLALLYVESMQELWVALAEGTIERLAFTLHGSAPRAQLRKSIRIGEAVTALSFMPRSRSRTLPEYRKGWICAGTMLGNLYHLDHLEEIPVPTRVLQSHASGPIRACLSLSRVAAEHGVEGDVLAVAHGGSLRYFVQPWPASGLHAAEPGVLDRPCAGRVFCLDRIDFGETVWLVAGANDECLHFYRIVHAEGEPDEVRSLLNRFADRQVLIPLPERVLAVAVRDRGGAHAEEFILYAALGDHRLQALRLYSTPQIEQRIAGRFTGLRHLEDLLTEIRRCPDDPVLRRNAIGLLFRAGWLARYVAASLWDASEARRLCLIVYHLLIGANTDVCREILSGILSLANRQPNFQPTATSLVRHISKYCLDGRSFSDKRSRLDQLAAINERNGGDYLYDAALYRSLLAERRYTEQELFELPVPVTSLQRIDHPLPCGAGLLLATSYERGSAWLLSPEGKPWSLELRALTAQGGAAERLQQVVLWEDPGSANPYAIFFYRNQGWTAVELEGLARGEKLRELAPPQPFEKDFFIYSYQTLPNGWVAVGGRTADVRLVRVSRSAKGLYLSLLPARHAGGSLQYAPVVTMAYRELAEGSGEIFAGCQNGACYRFAWDGQSLGEPETLWESTAPLRVVACQDRDHLLVGDSGGHLVLLRRLPKTTRMPSEAEFGPEWALRLEGGVTGIAATTLRVPGADTEPDRHWKERPVLAVSDSTGVLHVLRIDETREHSFGILLDGAGPSPIEHLISLSSAMTPAGGTQVAVACFDQTVRILSLRHRRESVRLLNADLTEAVVETLRSARADLRGQPLESARQALNRAVDSNLSIPKIRQTVLDALDSSLVPRITAEEIQGALEEVGWKLASANVQSESPLVLWLRLRFDDIQSFPALLDHISAMGAKEIRTPEDEYPHLQLRYCLRFAFKIIAQFVEDRENLTADRKRHIARFVHSCHSLSQNWGPDPSIDNLRCKLDIAHMLFRFATRKSLELLFGGDLDESLALMGGRSMAEFLEDRLLNDPRLAVPFRTIQHIRRMVEHDTGALAGPVRDFIVPPLIRRFRQCRTTREDAWVGMEIYLCLQTFQSVYGLSQWHFVAQLLHEGCPLSLLEFLADRQRILPPDDNRCLEVVQALSRAASVAASEQVAQEARRTIFGQLANIEESLLGIDGRALAGTLSCLRILTAVGIAFDSSSEHEIRSQARREIVAAQSQSMTVACSISTDEFNLLLECAHLLIRLSSHTFDVSFDTTRAIYTELKEKFALLLAGTAGALEPDVVRTLFLLGRETLRRQIEIEFEFVAPMRFLQERSFSEAPLVEEEALVEQLLRYASLHSELAPAETALFLRRDPSARGVIVDVVKEKRSQEVLVSRAQLRRRLEQLLGPHTDISQLQQGALTLLKAEPVATDSPPTDLFALRHDGLGEMIPVHREDQRYGLLFFAYSRTSAPDPSKRALSRMVPQFLVSEFMRSVQKQRLLSLTFHHISAPVAAMREMLRAMQAGYIQHDEQPKYLETLWYMVEDCRIMIENHLNYVRIVRGIAPPVLVKRFDLTAEAEFRRKVVHYKYKGSQQVLRWATTPDTIEVALDQMMVGDIIQNLLDNACKYSPAKSEIVLQIRTHRKEVFIEVSDQGPGLPENVASSLFAEGVRGEVASESKRPGLGLGLFMVYRYVIWLGGDVWYESGNRGGTTFTVRLPREVKSQ